MDFRKVAEQNLKLLKGESLNEYNYVDIPPQNIKPHNLPNWPHPGLVYTSPGVISQPIQKPGVGGGVGLYTPELFRKFYRNWLNQGDNYYG